MNFDTPPHQRHPADNLFMTCDTFTSTPSLSFWENVRQTAIGTAALTQDGRLRFMGTLGQCNTLKERWEGLGETGLEVVS